MSKRSHDEVTPGQMTVLGTTTFGRQNLQFIEDRPVPKLGSPNDVLVRVLYSDLNPVDHHKVRKIIVSFVPIQFHKGYYLFTGMPDPS